MTGKKPAAGLLAAVSVLLTACGGTENGSDDVGDTIKIGLSAPLTGAIATSGTATNCGLEAYFDAVNADGGINGYDLELTAKDNQFDPGISATLARDFATEGTFATVVVGTSAIAASTPVFEARDIAAFGTFDGATVTPPKWHGLFGYTPVYESEGMSAVSFIMDELGEDKAASVFLSPAAQLAGEGFQSGFEARGGEVVLNEALPSDVTDFSGLAQKLKASEAPVVYATVVDTQLAGLQKAADAIGYDPAWVAWPIAQGPTYLELAGDLAEDVYFAQWSLPETESGEPEVKEYLEAVGKVDGCAKIAGDNFVKTGYALAAAIAYGVEQVTAGGKEPTFDAFVEAMSDIEGQTFGLTPNMSFDSASHAGIRENSYWQVKSGELKKVRDFEPLPTS